jgi:hypothetical protein
MGIFYNPKIATDGLVLCLDAANRRSYPGTGTTWSDLAESNNGTLTNGPTFDAGNGGSIVFDGSDDYVNCGNDSIFTLTAELTLECWVKTSYTGGYNHFISKFPVSNCAYLIGSQQSNGYLYFSRSTNGANGGINGSLSINVCSGNWNHLVVSYNSTSSTLLMSVNATISSSSLTGSIYEATSNLEVGRRSGVGQYYPGNIATAKVYNRALTADEIRQNYNATKGRYL